MAARSLVPAVIAALASAGCGRRDAPAAAPADAAAEAPSRASPAPSAPPAASPLPADLVDVAAAIPDAVLDLRYATAANLTGAPIYTAARCLLHRDVASRLVAAAAALRRDGYRLVLWDCYRPAAAQRLLWARVADPRYVAPPRDDARGRPIEGSIHTRAAAIDVSLADLAGAPLAMPTDHDHFGPAAHRAHPSPDPAVRARAAALDRAMTDAGFVGIPTEWWHYAATGASRLPLRDDPL